MPTYDWTKNRGQVIHADKDIRDFPVALIANNLDWVEVGFFPVK
jgi:hypothetical protein